MTMIRYDPIRTLTQLQREFGRFFGDDLPGQKGEAAKPRKIAVQG